MKKLGLGLLVILLLNVFTSCEDPHSDLLEKELIDQRMDGGEEDEDDPIVSGG